MNIKKGLCLPAKGYLHLDPLTVINLIGDPGCDGLGAGIMSLFATALTAAEGDISLILGDMVPFGSKLVYRNVTEFINTIARNPVFTLKGNHDTEFFNEFFGSPNYALGDDRLLILVLDNAGRGFTDEALDFCRSMLHESGQKDVVICFHYPPPNPIVSNSVNPPEWNQLKEAMGEHISRVRYFASGHVHSLAETEIDGIPVLVSGGGGARIEPVNPDADESHHIIQLYYDESGDLQHRVLYLRDHDYPDERKDPQLLEKLRRAYENEISAHFRYKLLAVRAEEMGKTGLAALFRALSDSEFVHARNHSEVLEPISTIDAELRKSHGGESLEVETMYPEFAAYAEEMGHSLAKYSFRDAWNAEKVHKTLLEKALEVLDNEGDIPEKAYWTCSSCGYTFESETPPARCPVCGAPGDKIIKV